MSVAQAVTAAFNRGRVSDLGVARVEDIKRIALSASIMTNYMVRILGAMMLRAGWKYITPTKSNAQAIQVPFIFSVDDLALLELTALVMRIRISDVLVSRAAVSSTVTNGSFNADVASWTNADQAGAASAWAAGGYLSLVGTGTNAAIRRQQVTVILADQNIEHALRIVINRGPVVLRVGSTSGNDDYVSETTLGTGTHSLAFTPTGASFWIEFQNRRVPASRVDSCTLEAAGNVELPTPWATVDLSLIRWRNSQSADIIFVNCKGYQQRKIERRATRSWSVVLYEPEDGPFRVANVGPITITPSDITGDITLTASAALFKATQAPSTNSSGALFRLISAGQTISANISAENTFSVGHIKVTGVGTSRGFTVSLTGVWVATVTLQRSFDEGASWIDVTTYAANQSVTYDDGLDNQDIWYRIGVKTGNYTSGTVSASLAITTGSITGVAKITAFTTNVLVSARVLSDLGATSAMDNWAEGLWSDYRGWPSAGAFYEGRRWHGGKEKIVGSISDAFDQFDPSFEGDAGPINRSIGSGPVDDIAWILPLQRLIIGTQGSEVSCRSSALDEPLTPTAFNPKEATTQGAALVDAVQIDSAGAFVQRSGTRVYELGYDASINSNDYSLRDLTLLCPEFGEPGIVQLAVQRQPDTRIYCRRSDGTVGAIVTDRAEKVQCLLDIETDGEIEDIAIMPGTVEDSVYFTVKRTLASGTVRYLEKAALESECQGGTLNKQMDSFVVYSGAATLVITGLDHLEGEELAVWADGTDRSPGNPDEDAGQLLYTVTGGQITVTEGEAFTDAVAGIPYTAQWDNAKLAFAMALGTSLLQPKNIEQLGLMLKNTHAKGIKYGPDFESLDPMPDVEGGKVVDYDTVHATYDEMSFSFKGEWKTDSRLCLQSRSPRPCTVLAAVLSAEGHGKH